MAWLEKTGKMISVEELLVGPGTVWVLMAAHLLGMQQRVLAVPRVVELWVEFVPLAAAAL